MSLDTVLALRPADDTPAAIRAAIGKASATHASAVARADAIERKMADSLLSAGDEEMAEMERQADAEHRQAERLSALLEELRAKLRAARKDTPMKPVAIPLELADAIGAADAALTERARLEQLRVRIAEERAKAEATRAAAVRTAEDAETELLLSGDAAPKELKKQAEAARAAIASTSADLERFDRAAQGIGPKLAGADEAIMTARQRVQAEAAAFRLSVVGAFEDSLIQAADALATVLRAGHALAAAGYGSRTLLEEVSIPSAANHLRRLVSGARVELAPGDIEWLDQSWQNDAEAFALFNAYRPVQAVEHRLATEATRIGRERDREQEAANEARRLAWLAKPGSQYSTPPDRPSAEPPAPPPPRFQPNAWTPREPGTPAPGRETNVVAGIADEATASLAGEPAGSGWDAAMKRAKGVM